jgi:dephospho-CoA kinase
MIIGITGTNGSGKGAVVDYLVNEKGFTHYSNSGYISEELIRRGLELSRSNMRLVGNEFREKHGGGYLAEVALDKARADGKENIVIEAIRAVGEAKKIKEAGGVLLAINADRRLRFERIFARKSGKDLVDFDTFVAQEEREWQGTEGAHDMNIQQVMQMADHTIYNDNDTKALFAAVESFLAAFRKTT